MSQGLQDKFQIMTQAWNHQCSASAKRSEVPSSTEQENELDSHHHQSKKRKIAIETAFAIESEVQKWQRGIAELEAMLEEEANGDLEASGDAEGEAERIRPLDFVRFPSLPPIIPAEEGDFEGSDDDDESQDNGRCNATDDDDGRDIAKK